MAKQVRLQIFAAYASHNAPFAICSHSKLGHELSDAILKVWEFSWKRMGRTAPPLLVFDNGLRLFPAGLCELRHAGEMSLRSDTQCEHWETLTAGILDPCGVIKEPERSIPPTRPA